MCIHLEVHSPTALRVTIEDPERATQVSIVLASLLNSQLHRKENFWSVCWQDFKSLKTKLDKLGLDTGRTADPEAIAWIEAHYAYEDKLEAIKHGSENDLITALASLKTNLYADQISGVRFLATRDRAVVADEMGIGKTLELLATIAELRATDGLKHTLVICPNTVKTGWTKEVHKHTAMSVVSVSNGTKQVLDDIKSYAAHRTDILVVHYDALVQTAVSAKKNKNFLDWSEAVDLLLALPWDAIIFDEAHALKNATVRRTKACLYLVQNAKRATGTRARVYMATGTPISESPIDAWSLLQFLDPEVLPANFSKFENYFTIKVKKTGRSQSWNETVGYRNLQELKESIQHVMIRRLKSDMKGFPDKITTTRYIELTGEQKRLYDDIRAGLYDAIVNDPSDKLSIQFAMTKLIRLRQVLNSPMLVEREGNSVKYEALDELLEEIMTDPTAKVLIWTEWREAVEVIAARYAQKYGAIKLYSGVSQDTLKRYSMHWDVMPERVAVAIPSFAGTGTDWLKRCRTAIYVEPPYSTILFRQSIDRIHRRIGEVRTDMDRILSAPATLIFLQVEKTIDQMVYKVLERKGNMVDALLTDDEKLFSLGKAELLEYLR